MPNKLGMAWYRKEQWDRLLAVSADRQELGGTFEEWSLEAEKNLAKWRAEGTAIEKVDVDVEELVGWCKSRRLPIDERVRARFVAEKIRLRDL